MKKGSDLEKKRKNLPQIMYALIQGKIKTRGSSHYFWSEYKQAYLLNNQAHSL